MSADNWAICPRCRDRAKAEHDARFQAAVESYGKVTPEEYERLRAEAQVPFDPEKFDTFREDILVRWHKTGGRYGGDGSCGYYAQVVETGEHMHFTCRTCQYEWTGVPADAAA